jgi:hypothetical protein
VESFLVAGLSLVLLGGVVDFGILQHWVRSGFGSIHQQVTSLAMLASTAIMTGFQVLFSAFYVGILRGALTKVWVD